ncbi:MAG TPA: pitrilysin family protein [Thermoanaerobaculia bacterium]|nr:pitrilysin family protein [Thermoanaerobaculia bacterium]
MASLRRAAFTTALALVMTAATAHADVVPPRGPVLLAVPEDPTVAFNVWFKTGSQDDPPGKEGLAYLTGQMLAEGSTTANSYEEILRKLYPLAAGYGVRVDREMTTVSGRTHRDNLEPYVALFTDAYSKPAWKAEDFERVKSSTLNFLEKTLRYAQDEELGKAALYDAVFAGSRYAHPPQGTVAGVKAVTLDDVKAFHARHYTRDNAVIGLGGSYPAGLVQQLEATLAKLPAGKPEPAAEPRPRALSGRRVVLVQKPGADASISFGFPLTVRRGDPDYYPLFLANSWLGEHRNSSSHLYQVIREIRGLNYGDYSYVEAFVEGGQRQQPPPNTPRRQQLFEVWIRTLPNAQAVFALRAALREVQDLIDGGMTQEEFELTRQFLKKYSLHYAETTQDRLGYAIDDRFYGVPAPGHLALLQTRLDQLTREQVNAAIKKHWQLDDLQIAIVTGDAEGLKKALVSGAPTPITYPSEKPAEVLEEDKAIAAYPLGIKEGAVTIVPVDRSFESAPTAATRTRP